ncbi:MAG: 1-deoxy-D-xylulose-5-phosphate synthase [Leptospiraceae bacterium]|nr:1-deoxy-D-xylulose-5-phosphate synthase [Leptospiraceae bacterium]MCK6380108.1 1-deoxy-D-xylulose-5-phosphate synthase [Leptospiraceae bacterium]NUM40519.1 1-deoxy-D-xylulose-5-phosphate synthase [Leptospiraceae bacterium]
MNDYPNLSKVNFPKDIRSLNIKELQVLSKEIREYIIDTLSGIGGHFSSNLGVVELTVALHYVFETPIDRLIWDVGHQTYPHKILTGRKELLRTVRKFGGISGFPKREESEYDLYNTGHAGTSISQLLGEAMARDMLGKDYKCIAVIGDASIATGMALEALNHGGHVRPDCLVVLNDNYMSISKNVGSISTYLNNIISSHFYNHYRKLSYTFLKWLPIIGPALESFFKRVEKGIKDALMPGALFEDLGFHYIGPIDGHDIERLVTILKKIKKIEGPILLHVITQKGKGYIPAENDPIKYHGVTPFNKSDGNMESSPSYKIGFSQLVGKVLGLLTEKNSKIVVITPAMIEGSGLKEYSEKFQKHTIDVGIAEQHSIGLAAGLVSAGIIPYLSIYSTFLTRALDQIVEEISLMNLPVRFLIDRAGCVGPDGETHQGLFDLGYLCSLPNMSILTPSTGEDLISSIRYMEKFNSGPIAVRYPKSTVNSENLNYEKEFSEQEIGKSKIIYSGKDVTILSCGSTLELAVEIRSILDKKNISCTILDLLWIRPLDIDTIEKEISKTKRFLILDENYLDSGVSGYILNRVDSKFLNRFIKTFAFPSLPIIHGERSKILKHYGLNAEIISPQIEESLSNC